MAQIELLFKKARALHVSRADLTSSGFRTLEQTIMQIVGQVETLEQAMEVFELAAHNSEAELVAVNRAIELASTPALKDKLAHLFIDDGVLSAVEAADTFVDDYREEVAKNPSLTSSFLVIAEAMSWADYVFAEELEETDYRPTVLARARDLAKTQYQNEQVAFWTAELEQD